MTTAILLAAGKSSRMGANVDKAFLSLVDKPVVAWSLLAFERCSDIDRIVYGIPTHILITITVILAVSAVELKNEIAGIPMYPRITFKTPSSWSICCIRRSDTN